MFLSPMMTNTIILIQGWTAVVANLEDIFNEFCERSRNFKESFKKHRIKKEEYHEQLNA